ncbi:peptide synthetase [Streptomyces sp. NPDC091272]|uniref:phthiocerol/phthiodiolone dimycocerosyl transferase family protein n=1 Tax=Streptomyces sp. NPDC091272 TaxID=3365981 RepID=UPI003818653C
MTSSHGETVRPLGAFERTIDLYMHHNPLQFSLVAELDRHVTEVELAAALTKLRTRHPMLGVMVDRTTPQAVYRRTGGAIPVTTRADGTPWQAVVTDEQIRPLPPAPDGPSVRAVLVPRGGRCDLVLTFAHQITDGVGALRALLDLVAVLDGAEPGPGCVPETLEDLLARVAANPDAGADPGPAGGGPGAGPGPGPGPGPRIGPGRGSGPAPAAATAAADDPRMHTGGELIPSSGELPHLQALALDRELTTRLVDRCRRESTSVHAALCTAAAVAFHRRGREFVRVLTPMDLRRACDLPDEVVNRFAGARTASEAHEADDFWKLARATRASLARQRHPAALKAAGAALAEHAPASAEQAEAMMGAATAADIQITNLGVAQPNRRSASTLTALWGPGQITQLRGEHVLGVVTLGGQLRMTELTHDPVAGLVTDIAAALAEACAGDLR